VPRRRRYTDEEAREAIASSLSYSDALRRLGMRPAGGNHRTLKVLADRLAISTDHFDPHAAQREALLAEIGASSWCAVGRKYGVSDNAVRKWVRQYERER
jgi:transposase-like protein